MQKILVIEDEKKILEIVEAYLKKEGFEPIMCDNGEQGLESFYDKNPSLVVLDLMLPDIPGEEICDEMKKFNNTPIIMLTAKSTIDDRINGLSIGADDYLIKPFSPRELMMRIKVILKRYGQLESLSDVLSFNQGDLVIYKGEHKVKKLGKEIELTPVEYRILTFLSDNRSMKFSRDGIIDKVFGQEFEGFDRTIDVHIKNIRKKIEDNPKEPVYIKTVFGFGYKFEGEFDEKENKTQG
ncbi:MAG: response regulator transcription factor [Tissierellales bacterium]|nr:response regulator transcription factor [Tissierellales bacterium]MBN2827428.1 response regulator transcription factor [Tissierellales bacterium]